ncbi:MAG: hypothetical protein J5614_08380 [Paludibacteraceae bacterium]|nr:hypothetical protein [Paludibacteraceae bacterium]
MAERLDQHNTDLPGGKDWVIDTFYDDRIFLHPNAKLEIVAGAAVYRPIHAQSHSEIVVRGVARTDITMHPYSKIYVYGFIQSLRVKEGAEVHIYGGNVHNLESTCGKIYFYGRGYRA